MPAKDIFCIEKMGTEVGRGDEPDLFSFQTRLPKRIFYVFGVLSIEANPKPVGGLYGGFFERHGFLSLKLRGAVTCN